MTSRSNSIQSENSSATSTAEIAGKSDFSEHPKVENTDPSSTAQNENKEDTVSCCSCFSFFRNCFSSSAPERQPMLSDSKQESSNYDTYQQAPPPADHQP